MSRAARWDRSTFPAWFGEHLTRAQLQLPIRQLWIIGVCRTGACDERGRHAPGDNGLDATARHVALTLAAFMDAEGRAEVAQRVLADAAGMRPRWLKAVLHGADWKDRRVVGLQEAGWLSVQRHARGGHVPTTYRARLPRLDPRCSQCGEPDVHIG